MANIREVKDIYQAVYDATLRALKVTGSVAVSALPLPSGAATDATLSAILNKVATEVTLSALKNSVATEVTLSSVLGNIVLTLSSVNAVLAKLNDKINVTQTGVTTIAMPVELDAPIPTGTNSIGQVTCNAGTDLDTSALALESGGNLDTIAGDTTSIDGKITACDTTGLALETGGNLETLAGKDFATETTLNEVANSIDLMISTDGVKKITDDVNVKIVDTSGNPQGLMTYEGAIGVVTPGYQIAQGLLTGHQAWSNYAYNPAVATTEEDVWGAGGKYTLQTAESAVEILSSDNTQDIGTVIFGDATGNTVQSDADGTTTTLEDDSQDFTAGTPVAVGDCVILDPHGTTPEWGYVTGVAATTLTVAGGFSSGGTGASRYYAVIDKSAYTNAQAIAIKYLDDTFTPHTEIAVLNGTTVVDLINTDYYRVNGMRLIAAGSNGVALGNITLRVDGGGNTLGYITAGYPRSRQGIFTVPKSKELYVSEWFVGAATPNDTKVQTCRVIARENRDPEIGTDFDSNGIKHPFAESLVSNSEVVRTFTVPIKFTEGTDVVISAIGFTGFNGPVVSIMRGWIENE